VKKKLRFALSFLAAPAAALLCFRFKGLAPAKWYPVAVSGGMFFLFAGSFLRPPVIIFRFALRMDRTIRGSGREKPVERYCRKVTLLWCAFFLVNGGIAAATVFQSNGAWLLYNGCISYILMGILFLGEFMVRQTVDKNLRRENGPPGVPGELPISRFTPASRPADAILCYDGAYADGKYQTWRDFLRDTALLRAAIAPSPQTRWILYADDYWHFLTAFVALLQCRKQPLLPPSTAAALIAGIAGEGGAAALSDQDIPGAVSIPQTLAASGEAPSAEHIPINPVESVFMIYTSGSTGKPKGIPHRLVEFEVDIGFPPEWVAAWRARKNAVTVNQHHIYGLVFSIILPFTLGVPFRRKRLERPEELPALADTPYMIFTSPAFLKRAVESGLDAKLRDPWIVASGGFLPQEIAEKTSRVLGAWPIDIYGSTEGSGIAWRQSKDGPQWRPFSSIKVSTNEAGCLVIHLPFPNVPPIPTGDLAEVLSDGRFILKGRADSIVKIEEKRVSLTEVEARIMESGLAQDAAVIPLEDRRQYLAAAIVLSSEGKERFAGKEKHEINQFWTGYLQGYFEGAVTPKKWRYVERLPEDAQGKKQRAEIEALFAPGALDDAPGAGGGGV
jgi:acyl-coenzyme A synthetase/AMP-(fatty) acid ligase